MVTYIWRKAIGIVLVILFIGATVSPAVGTLKENEPAEEKFFSYDKYNEIVPGEFIVKFSEKGMVDSPAISALNEKHQVYSVKKVFKNAEDTILEHWYVLKVSKDSDIVSIVNEYSSSPDIVYAEPNGFVHLCAIPNDPDFSNQWALHNTGQIILDDISGTPDVDIDAPEAWDYETGDSEVVIAIIDSGIDYTHPDLAANIWINEDEIPDNDIDDDDNGYIDDTMGWDFCYDTNDPLDGHGHGTHCAGIPAAVGNNNIGISGVCWNCKIMPVRVANENWTAYWTDVAEGIKYAADNNADIISMSFGHHDNVSYWWDAVEYAYGKGVFICAGAGNDNTSNIFYPAGYNHVIAIAATNQHDERCDGEDWIPGFGSNYGDWVDIAAPGNLIYSTMPTYPVVMNDENNPSTGQNFSQDYDFCGGTSMAGPQVAGLAALILSKNPSYSQDEVKTLICENVDPYNSNEYIGTGRINAYKALTEFYTNLDIEVTGGVGAKAIITNNGLVDAVQVPYELTVTGGILGLINKTVNGTIDIKVGTIESISSGLLFGLGSIEINVTIGVKNKFAKGMQFFIFTLV